MEKLYWSTKQKADFSQEQNFLEVILKSAGIEDIEAFINVSQKNEFDPFLFKNMEKGIKLLHDNLGKTIYLQPDSDVDGVTSSAYFYQFIKKLNPETNIIFNLHFNKEHGIIYEDIKDIEDLALIIVPDAGSGKDQIEDYKKIKNNMNVPILTIDHHNIDKEVYKYTTLINCKDGVYPNADLSGVGVVHKFCLAYCKFYNIDVNYCNEYLDLVALGMIADSMDMRNLETRYYTLEGLKEENRKNLLIKEFALKYSEEMKLGHTIKNYGWVIAPKINAVIRYGKPKEQKNLFRALCGIKEEIEYQPRRKRKTDPKPAMEIHSLQKTMARVAYNVKQRQDKEVRDFMKKIDKIIKEKELYKNSVLMLDNYLDIKKTVSGLVANKIAEKYKRPVLILKSTNKDELGGSARGYDKGKIKDFNKFLTETGYFSKCAG